MNVERIRIVSPYAEREAHRIERDHKKTLLKDAVSLEEDKGRKQHNPDAKQEENAENREHSAFANRPKQTQEAQPNVDVVA